MPSSPFNIKKINFKNKSNFFCFLLKLNFLILKWGEGTVKRPLSINYGLKKSHVLIFVDFNIFKMFFPKKKIFFFVFFSKKIIFVPSIHHLRCNVPFNLVNVSYWFIIGVVISHFYPKMIKIHVKFWRKTKKKQKIKIQKKKKNPTFCLM